jgi:membrane associated rhomboid family serine protease
MGPIIRAIIVASFVATAYSLFDPSVLRFAMDPAAVKAAPISADTVVRFVIFQFLHGGIVHLLSNTLFLWYFGTGVERAMGERRFFAFFVFSTLLVGIAIVAFANGPTIGVSGFALAVLTYAALRMKDAGNPEYRGALLFIAINVGFGLVGNVSLVGHAAGAVAGGLWWLAEKGLRRP